MTLFIRYMLGMDGEPQMKSIHPHLSEKGANAVLIFLVLLFSLPPTALAEEEIIWVKRHFPPAFILEGEMAGQGIHDRTVAILQEQMPEYRHRVVLANHPRMKKMMAGNANVCRAGLYRTPLRERTMHMSIAHILVPPHRIFIKKSLLPKVRPLLEKEGYNRISLEKIIQNHPELILGIEAQRSYGKPIDAVLNRYRTTANLSLRYESDSRGYIKMLMADRIDGLIEIPAIFLYALRRTKATMDNFCSLEISESRDFLLAHIGCSKTAAGQAIIERINAILRKERGTDAFRRNMEYWYDPDTLPVFREAYESVFLADTPTP